MTCIALDVGDRRIGIAKSATCIAGALETYNRKHDSKIDIEYICNVLREQKADILVVGLPKLMSGIEGEQARKTRDFAEAVAAETGIELVYWDERLSSVAAESVLKDSNIRREKRKQHIDKIAAVIILQNYLDYKGGTLK